MALGMVSSEICPIVKRIWTPSWVLYSTAWTLWMLAGFYGLIDVLRYRRWAFPLVVVGMNSIAIYMMSQLLKDYTARQVQMIGGTLFAWLHNRFGHAVDPDIFGGTYGPIIRSVSVLAVFWVVCWWMYRRKIFLRI
jgi:predicted acyltransferase